MEHKSCVYCGKKRCKCRYQERLEGCNVLDLRELLHLEHDRRHACSFESLLRDLDDATPATWSISYTLVEHDANDSKPAQDGAKKNVVIMPKTGGRCEARSQTGIRPFPTLRGSYKETCEDTYHVMKGYVDLNTTPEYNV